MIVHPSDVNFDGRPLVSHVLQFLLNCLRTASGIVQIVFQQLRRFLEGQLDDGVGSEPEGNPFETLFGLSPHEDAFAEHEVDLSTCMRWGVYFSWKRAVRSSGWSCRFQGFYSAWTGGNE